jgi:hypothetical protein
MSGANSLGLPPVSQYHRGKAMRKPIPITTPMPTFEEVAKEYRVPKRREKVLRALVEKFAQQVQEKREVSAAKTAGKGKKRRNASAAA